MKVLVVTNMYPTPDMPTLGTFVYDQVKALKKKGVEVDVLFIHGRKSKLNYLWGIFRLWNRLLTHSYDLIHAHYVFSGIVARAQFLRPVVLTQHGPEVFMTWERYPCHMITPLVDKVIVVSQEQKEKLRWKKAVVIPCGIDFERFRPIPREDARGALGLPREKKLVLWAGEYTRPEKRFDIVKAAVALTQGNDPSIELVLVSDKPHDVVPLYMNGCDVLLLVSDGEGSPMVIKEAMACNLPIVSVPAGDVRDVIGKTEGCYICSQDPVDVAQKLTLALNPQRRTDGREMIRYLEQGNIAKRIISVYDQVLHRGNGKYDDNVSMSP